MSFEKFIELRASSRRKQRDMEAVLADIKKRVSRMRKQWRRDADKEWERIEFKPRKDHD